MHTRHLLRHIPRGGKTFVRPLAASSSSRKRASRIEIVNPELCDLTLTRLRDTLPEPGTCDLIDINPGKGLWSQKLHDLLRPRRHVLVEPNYGNYAASLEPLLTENDSTYRHAAVLEDAFNPDNKLMSEYPVDKALQPNHSLLMTVNLSGAQFKTNLYKGSPARKFFSDLYMSLWRIRTDIHRYGLIRVLAWVPDEEKDAYIPRTVGVRRAQAVMLEASHKIQELVGGPANDRPTFFQKWREMEVQDRARVKAMEEAAGLQIPEHRRDEISPTYLLGVFPSPENIRRGGFVSDAAWVARFLELDDHLREVHPEWYKRASIEHLRKLGIVNPEQQEWQSLLKVALTQHKTHMRAVELVKEQRRVDQDLRNLAAQANYSQHSQPSEKEAELRRHCESLKFRISILSRTNRLFAEKAIDDYRALDLDPPVMSWNQRVAEPILVHDDDFLPKTKNLALLDVTPRVDFLQKISTHDTMVYFGYVQRNLWLSWSRTVYDALKTLVHAGVDDFIETIQGIHDPTKGGHYDLSAIRVRSLPVELVVEIALAYERWPFRRDLVDILMSGEDPQAAYSLSDDD
ncbi:hypothetical protein PV08_10825 [Exophiala spinifera]|uniref:rRNA adenine N(6)-methyltransferase n=1 Tax=Exophiala spinifera TaxID=91928 RepID=A0A0D2BJT0_9EURO|nr:uncharacterized protein PV08_10825 [Exophiala spinifera]KIW11524.1 hypothetical protein PV08_10825 [Exophiala spinifera]